MSRKKLATDWGKEEITDAAQQLNAPNGYPTTDLKGFSQGIKPKQILCKY
jgi:hypothetical protein